MTDSPQGPPVNASCLDCHVTPGQPHIDGCDTARCTACGEQRIACEHGSSDAGWGQVWSGLADAATGHPRKIYLATAGEYSDYRVIKAFTTSDDAWRYPLGDDVLELELHDKPVEVRMWSQVWWWPHEPDTEGDGFSTGNPSEHHTQKDFDGRPKWVEHRWSHNNRGQSLLVVEGWDMQRVRKVYSEQRAQHLARQDTGVTPEQQ